VVWTRPIGDTDAVVTGVTSVRVRRAQRRRQVYRFLRNSVLFMGVAAVAGYGLGFHHSYGSWPGLAVGDRIHWCGQDYRAAVTDLTLTEVNTDPSHPVEQLFSYPPHIPRADVYGIPTPAGSCPSALYVHSGSDRYTKYLPPTG
jgi:hypothetical protein